MRACGKHRTDASSAEVAVPTSASTSMGVDPRAEGPQIVEYHVSPDYRFTWNSDKLGASLGICGALGVLLDRQVDLCCFGSRVGMTTPGCAGSAGSSCR
jgi:hypothetical protein